jgi:hypothetical protein
VLVQLKNKYAGKIEFISLTIEPDDTAAKIADGFPAELHYARASLDAWASFLNMGGKNQSVPTHALIKPDGDLHVVLEGSKGLEDAVAQLVP